MSEKLATKIRLSRESFLSMRVLSAKNDERHMYQIVDMAICWCLANSADVQPLFNPQSNERRTIYLTKIDTLNRLSETWDCTRPEAVYSAINHYLSHVEGH